MSATTNTPKLAFISIIGDETTRNDPAANSAFPVVNMFDWKSASKYIADAVGTKEMTFDFGAAVDVDYFAAYGIKLEELNFYWSDTGTAGPWTAASLNSGLAEVNQALFDTFDSENHRYWRVSFVNASNPAQCGVLAFGEYLELEQGLKPGFAPAQVSRDWAITNNESESGSFIGRSVTRKSSLLNISAEQFSKDWINNNWIDALDTLLIQPFFFQWNPDEEPTQVVYAWTLEKIPPNAFTTKDRQSLSLNCRAQY